MEKIVEPMGYESGCPPKYGSRIFGKQCESETYLYCGTKPEEAPAFAVFYGSVSEEKIARIAAILNEE